MKLIESLSGKTLVKELSLRSGAWIKIEPTPKRLRNAMPLSNWIDKVQMVKIDDPVQTQDIMKVISVLDNGNRKHKIYVANIVEGRVIKNINESMKLGDFTFDIGRVYTWGDGFSSKINEEGAFFEDKEEYPEPVKKVFNKFGIPPNAHSTVLTMMAYINKNPRALKQILKAAGMLENKKGEN